MRLILGMLLALLLAACGQKGPLYLPDQKPAVVTGAPGSAAPPATPDAAPPTLPKRAIDADDPGQP